MRDFGLLPEINKICPALWYYAADSYNYWLTFRYYLSLPYSRIQKTKKKDFFFDSLTLEDGTTGCPETSVRNYHYTLHDATEERRSQCWVIYLIHTVKGYNWYLSPFLYISFTQSRTQTLLLLFIGVIQHALQCRPHAIVLLATLPHQRYRISRLQTWWREI